LRLDEQGDNFRRVGLHARLDPGHHLLDLSRSQAVLEIQAQRGEDLIRCELNGDTNGQNC